MEQKENGWWKKSFGNRFKGWKIHHKSVPCVKDEFVIEEIKSFISQVEQDARKDERERVLGEAMGIVEEYKIKDVAGFFLKEGGIGYNNACSDISTALKGLSGNNE